MKRYMLFSGGIDSVVALDILMNTPGFRDGPLPVLVFFDYCQSCSDEERRCFGIWACQYDLNGRIIHTSAYKHALIDKPYCDWVFNGATPPESGEYAPDLLTLPGRNLFLLTMAAIELFDPNDTVVEFILGTHLYEEGNFAGDCSENFLKSAGKTLSHAMSTPTRQVIYKVYSPVQKMTKKDILDYMVSHKIGLENTWTCYLSGTKPCGNCRHCKELKKSGLL
jgi:7-cyano-7-deazaguanine synthase in queuosine biosynthesis